MFEFNLLQKTICILLILSIIGECAVIPPNGDDSQFPESDGVYKWDSVSRLKSKIGPSDSTTRDRLLNSLGKVPRNPQKWPSAADDSMQKLDALRKSKVERDGLRSGKEFDLIRSTKPLSVKQTAGHVGYEERHRFSGIPFDQLLDSNGAIVEPIPDGPGGTFESDHEESENEADDDEEYESLAEFPDPVFEKSEAMDDEYQINASGTEESLDVSNWVASSQSIALGATDGRPPNPKKGKKAPSQIHWRASSQSKVSGSSSIQPKSEEGEQLSNQPAADELPGTPHAEVSPQQLHWKASSKSKVSTAPNRHDQHIATPKSRGSRSKKAEGRQRRENGPIDTTTSSHRGPQST